ncbi:DNA-binding transcriptional regulator, MerR family [Halobacillus karajensis]|uniref:MerR family transcriptional regulator n=1 Tax=Halobacillus karajensis TaxID=195088 RepID=UPI0008A7EFB5|nr:MerR family transcriptional regulator [Halobacillus karajensis]SEI08154.1 DNA-binding transcriptional regulator, MerR family [Halobacillus karajensis]
MYKVKEVATMAGVSVRTLHHYDHIGLLSPGNVNEKGYRLYGEREVARLQQILFFKEMDFSLPKIKQILDDPEFDEEEALQHHREILWKKKARLERLIQSVDQTLETVRGGTLMEDEKRFKPFDMSEIEEHQKKYEKEVEERWGDTEAYKESKRKTNNYTDEDWKRIQEESNRIDRELVKLMGRDPSDEEVQRLIGEKRQHITDNFYECKGEIFRGLADMYVNDPRFTKNIDKWNEGYAEFLKKAIHTYCDRLG